MLKHLLSSKTHRWLEAQQRRERLLAEIEHERHRQDELKAEGRFTHTCADSGLTDDRRLTILTEEVGEAAKEVQGGNEYTALFSLKKELAQVAAVALAWMENLDARLEKHK